MVSLWPHFFGPPCKLENKTDDKKICHRARRAKNQEIRRCQRQSEAQSRATGLTARRYDVGLTLRHRRYRGQQSLYS